jgi:apolipoprotein N-acyltransferase
MKKGDAVSNRSRLPLVASGRAVLPLPTIAVLALAAALLSVLSFPNFDFWFLAWVGAAPLLFAAVVTRRVLAAGVAGWVYGTIFFYGSCWWLTYPMIRYGGISPWLAYPLFLLPVMFVALFPAIACALIAMVMRRLGAAGLCVAPFIWTSIDWLRYLLTGQLWNTLGYSQAFHPLLIQSARTGGVYAVTFLLIAVNAAVVFLLIQHFRIALAMLAVTLLLAFVLSLGAHPYQPNKASPQPVAVVLAIQPNVPMDLGGDPVQMEALLQRHLSLTKDAFDQLTTKYGTAMASLPRLVIWPESPMNFSYSRDPKLREIVADVARANHASILLNSLEPAADGGDQNSALLINQEGVIAARYDKIRLMPFGEYVPLPRWLPGAGSVRGLVGEFEPGRSYTLMPLGAFRAGVFICIEAAHPAIARTFTQAGANVLVNISNDGYLGPTAVMRQHLSNAIFRAVENNRQLLRVTNSGITANISSGGATGAETAGFQPEIRVWTIDQHEEATTFYTRHGDVFVYGCALISLGIVSASFMSRKPERKRGPV